MKKIILTTTALAVLASSSAQAIESDFFVKVNTGYSKMSKVKSAKAKNDVFFGVGAGYYVMDNVRADLTFDHFISPTFKKDGKVPNSITLLPEWYNPAGHINNGLLD